MRTLPPDNDVVALLRRQGETIRIINRLDRRLVRADSQRIGLVLINLIVNASKYSPPDSQIVVTALRRGDRVRIQVADRGTGFPAGAADDLFVAYTRTPEAGLTGVDGAGLGLAIVKSIVDLHGGTVGANRRRGGGSIFWIELPGVSAEEQTSASTASVARRRFA